jgi:hypothetical protein
MAPAFWPSKPSPGNIPAKYLLAIRWKEDLGNKIEALEAFIGAGPISLKLVFG